MSNQGGRRKAEGGICPTRSRCARASFIASPASFRLGVTLIELLITITIVATLSATFLGVSRVAMESSRAARTKSTINKLHTLLMEKWSSYETRRVDVNALTSSLTLSGSLRGRAQADIRLLGLRELMKLEMPDRWSDVILTDVPNSNPLSAVAIPQSVLDSLPAITSTYRRRYYALRSPDTTPLDRDRIIRNQGAECLYMIIMLTTADGEARTLFSDQDIGDTDDDGAPEFLDGWGRPIDFIRWPAGIWERSDLMGGPLLTDTDHDAFDAFRRDQVGVSLPLRDDFPNVPVVQGNPESPITAQELIRQLRDRNNTNVLELPDGSTAPVGAFRLVPFVFSTGPDGISDINASEDFVTALDPYAIDDTNQIFRFGVPADTNNDGDDNSLDNIHNHLQDNR